MSRFTIAAAQSSSTKGDIESNIRAHAEFVRTAVKHDVDVIIFPELSLTGYELEIASDSTVSIEDERLSPLKQLAKRFDITIVVGAPAACPEGKPHIGALVLNSDSSFIYAKQFLHAGEDKYFSPGTKGCVMDVKGVSVGLAICADINHPVHARRAAESGAVIYAAGVLITDGGYTADARLLRQYATEHSMAVVMANYGSPTGGYVSAGKSAIWDDSGKLLATADGTGEVLIVATRDRGNWTGTTIRHSRKAR